jgi:hypothetical protein
MVKMQERHYPRKSAETFIARAKQILLALSLPSQLMLWAPEGQRLLELEFAR